MNKRLAIIGSGEMAVIIVENAKKMGIVTHTFSNNPRDRVVGYSDFHHNVDIFDIDTIVEICKELRIEGVISTTELTISVAAEIADRLNLNGMPPELSKKVTDKGFVRERAKLVAAIRQPSYMLYERGEEYPQIREYPVIVKPTEMGGKRGVSVAFSQAELDKSIRFALDDMPDYRNKIIIENFIEKGTEYSVESLSYHGKHKVIQVTQKITSGPPHCVELGHIQPALLNNEMREKIEKVIPELLEIVGVDNTTSHTEIKVVDDDIYLVELNARSGGDHIAYPMTELSTGYPYIQGAIEIAMNTYSEPDLNAYKKKNCGVLFIAKQTSNLKILFENCEKYSWLYKKNKVTDGLQEIIHNNAFDTNYMMYLSENGIPKEIRELIKI